MKLNPCLKAYTKLRMDKDLNSRSETVKLLEESIGKLYWEALFRVAKMGKQPKCPSVNERIKKMCLTHTHAHICIHTHIYRQWNIIHPLKEGLNNTWINLEVIMQSEYSSH